ncbi:MAG: hypothetical protein IT247_08920 [Bacteroidia bacterium]|nr:hypothetical protein [Bacteroidia bacterium]
MTDDQLAANRTKVIIIGLIGALFSGTLLFDLIPFGEARQEIISSQVWYVQTGTRPGNSYEVYGLQTNYGTLHVPGYWFNELHEGDTIEVEYSTVWHLPLKIEHEQQQFKLAYSIYGLYTIPLVVLLLLSLLCLYFRNTDSYVYIGAAVTFLILLLLAMLLFHDLYVADR